MAVPGTTQGQSYIRTLAAAATVYPVFPDLPLLVDSAVIQVTGLGGGTYVDWGFDTTNQPYILDLYDSFALTLDYPKQLPFDLNQVYLLTDGTGATVAVMYIPHESRRLY